MYRTMTKIFTIQIISGQNLPKIVGDKKDIIDPFISVKVIGYDSHNFTTKVISNNGKAFTSGRHFMFKLLII